jgi:cytidylate kinase
MIVALSGASSTGKTTLARLVTKRLDLPLRSCGDCVRAVAKSRSIKVQDLPRAQHEIVDAQTVAWATAYAEFGAIVEGRFVDAVLVPLGGLVRVIEVTATLSARAERWAKRMDDRFTEKDVLLLDKEDSSFRKRMYTVRRPLEVDLRIDTTTECAERCADDMEMEIRKWMSRPV